MSHPPITSNCIIGISIQQLKPVERTVGVHIERIGVRALVYREVTLEIRRSVLIHGNLARSPVARRIISVFIHLRYRQLRLLVLARQRISGRQRLFYQAVAILTDIIELDSICPLLKIVVSSYQFCLDEYSDDLQAQR